MSFITKRERVFNEYSLYDLPSRNEGKLKAYASCTDARAWSHFCSDQAEHLVEIIKRNNETCRPKYVPIDVIINTLMSLKNSEIQRLKRRIQEFEQLLTAYDELELTCQQRCEIAQAQAEIKAANKELEDMCLDLDMSGITEGIDSEAFETGKSRGDEGSKLKAEEWQTYLPTVEVEDKSTQSEVKNDMGDGRSDISISVSDPRINEMQDTIINKDAKLNAMRNTIAVMENDVCEPYCIYAHIYTTLEKIFGTLSQNEKYREYLNLLCASKDVCCSDIKAKILLKLKVLEKFSLALIAPCSQEFASGNNCSCYYAELEARVFSAFAVTTTENKISSLDNKRALLVADIIENDEIREIISRESISSKQEDDTEDDGIIIDDYNINIENLNRLKNLQSDFDELMHCYENLKSDKDAMQRRCQQYDELQREVEGLRNQLREYNSLWAEKEHYRKRSEDLDKLKQQFLILRDETLNLETQLKNEAQINQIKSNAIAELREENIELEKKLNDSEMASEKEKNLLQCKIKECECQSMCQEQQIKSLSNQVQILLEREHELIKQDDPTESLLLNDEVEALRYQINNLRNALVCCEEEREQLQTEFQDKLNLINELRMDAEEWKSSYEKVAQRNKYLESYTDNFKDEIDKLQQQNEILNNDIQVKTVAVDNLHKKSADLTNMVERKDSENRDLYNHIQKVQELYNETLSALDLENKKVSNALQQESQELLKKVQDINKISRNRDEMQKSLELKSSENELLKSSLINIEECSKKLNEELSARESNASILLKKIEHLDGVNNLAMDTIKRLKQEKSLFENSYELEKKESEEMLRNNSTLIENLTRELHDLKQAHEKIIEEKTKLEHNLSSKNKEFNDMRCQIELSKKGSDVLLKELEDADKDSKKLKLDLNLLENTYKKLRLDYDALEGNLCRVKDENAKIVSDLNHKTNEINNLMSSLDAKNNECQRLLHQINKMQKIELEMKSNITTIENENINIKLSLDAKVDENINIKDKLNGFNLLRREFDALKQDHANIKSEKERIENNCNSHLIELAQLRNENSELLSQCQNLQQYNNKLEDTLVDLTKELSSKSVESSSGSVHTILQEIEILKKEILSNQYKLKELNREIDSSDATILDLKQQLQARDDTISVLENHINALQGEIKFLQETLAEGIEAGEQISETSSVQLEESFKILEAHHSKATHNMKIHMASLQNDNGKLQEQLSFSKVKTEEGLKDKHKCLSQLLQFQEDREIIISNLKQLELTCTGSSSLLPNKCSIEDVLASIERIRQCLLDRDTTLFKVQTSSQMLLTKADEAKKLIEREKQKITTEKEDAIREKVNLENQLCSLKENLKEQITQDKNLIIDLRAEISNQKLITEELNKSIQDYITKLDEDKQKLQHSLQQQIDTTTNLSSQNVDLTQMIENLKLQLRLNSKDMMDLQNQLENFNDKSIQDNYTQTQYHLLVEVSTQTTSNQESNGYHSHETDISDSLTYDSYNNRHDKIVTDKYLPIHQVPEFTNEVQILTANVEPSLDFIRNTYLNFKIKRLAAGKLEHYSISSSNSNEIVLTKSFEKSADGISTKTATVHSAQNDSNLIDIYNRESVYTSSSKVMNNMPIENLYFPKETQSPKSSSFTEFSFEDKSNNNSKNLNVNAYEVPEPGNSTEKDVFIVYRDSESTQANIIKHHGTLSPTKSAKDINQEKSIDCDVNNLDITSNSNTNMKIGECNNSVTSKSNDSEHSKETFNMTVLVTPNILEKEMQESLNKNPSTPSIFQGSPQLGEFYDSFESIPVENIQEIQDKSANYFTNLSGGTKNRNTQKQYKKINSNVLKHDHLSQSETELDQVKDFVVHDNVSNIQFNDGRIREDKKLIQKHNKSIKDSSKLSTNQELSLLPQNQYTETVTKLSKPDPIFKSNEELNQFKNFIEPVDIHSVNSKEITVNENSLNYQGTKLPQERRHMKTEYDLKGSKFSDESEYSDEEITTANDTIQNFPNTRKKHLDQPKANLMLLNQYKISESEIYKPIQLLNSNPSVDQLDNLVKLNHEPKFNIDENSTNLKNNTTNINSDRTQSLIQNQSNILDTIQMSNTEFDKDYSNSFVKLNNKSEMDITKIKNNKKIHKKHSRPDSHLNDMSENQYQNHEADSIKMHQVPIQTLKKRVFDKLKPTANQELIFEVAHNYQDNKPNIESGAFKNVSFSRTDSYDHNVKKTDTRKREDITQTQPIMEVKTIGLNSNKAGLHKNAINKELSTLRNIKPAQFEKGSIESSVGTKVNYLKQFHHTPISHQNVRKSDHLFPLNDPDLMESDGNVTNYSSIESIGNKESEHILPRVRAESKLFSNERSSLKDMKKSENTQLLHIDNNIQNQKNSDEKNKFKGYNSTDIGSSFNLKTRSSTASTKIAEYMSPSNIERGVLVKLDTTEEYENKIKTLRDSLHNIEKDYKKKIEAIKIQYDSNIKSILIEHNQGVKSIQNLHEETLQDIIKVHENEVENLRTMSIEAMRKADKLEKENLSLKNRIQDCTSLDEEPVKIITMDEKSEKIEKRKKHKSRSEMKTLTKTNVEAFNVKPKLRSLGPCTCSVDVNLSDTIRNIFDQVDIDQRKVAEQTYLKYIANKIMSTNIESLDAQELSFLHLKVCRSWKNKLSKEEALQKRIDSLETELMHKQRNAQHHIAEIDRKVEQERRRLQEVREAICRQVQPSPHLLTATVPETAEKDLGCQCSSMPNEVILDERRSGGDLVPRIIVGMRPKRTKPDSHRATMAKIDLEERRERKLNDEQPTRLRRTQDRHVRRK